MEPVTDGFMEEVAFEVIFSRTAGTVPGTVLPKEMAEQQE